ncbi:MAG TPA: branched-chain amino acid transaminase [Patescibacteria group bacterium]
MKTYVFLNGKFVLEDKALVSVSTHAFQYGTGCFEGIRAYYSTRDDCLYVFRMREHYARLIKSAKVLFVDIPYSVDRLCDLTLKLLQKNYAKKDFYIRPFAYKSDTNIFKFFLPKIENGFGIFTVPLNKFIPNENGIKVNVSSWTRISDASIPPRAKIMGSYVNTSLAKTESIASGYEEALLLDKFGHVVEGSAENIFLVSSGKIFTPPVYDDILQGITRGTVMELLEKALDLKTVEQSISRTQLYQADEIFLVGTGAEVVPVIEVDGRKVGEGKVGIITKKVKDIYEKVVRGEDKSYSKYCTKVKKF